MEAPTGLPIRVGDVLSRPRRLSADDAVTAHEEKSTAAPVFGQDVRALHLLTALENGGAQRNTIASVRAARARGFDDRLAAGDGPLAPSARADLGAGFEPLRRLVRPIRPLGDLLTFFEILRLLRRLRPRILHTHSSKAGLLGRLAARVAGVPLVVHTVHGWPFHPYQSSIVRWIYIFLERTVADRTDALVCVARTDMEKGLAERIGRRDQYRLVRSGVDFAPLESVRARRKEIRASVREALGVPATAEVVLTVANLKPQKDPLTWARVALRVTAARPATWFLFVGDGELRAEVERILVAAGPAARPRIRLLSWRDDVAELLAASDLFFLPSRHEGLPRALVEASRLEVPAVASGVDGIVEIVRDGRSGLLRAPGDEAGFARAISEVLDRPDRGAEFARDARARTEGFSQERMSDDLFALYDRLLR